MSCSHLQLQSWCSWILCTALTVPRQVQASHLFAATPSYDEVVSRLCLQRQVADPQLADVRHTCVAVGENVLSAQPLESIKWTNCEGIPEAECSKTPDCVWCKVRCMLCRRNACDVCWGRAVRPGKFGAMTSLGLHLCLVSALAHVPKLRWLWVQSAAVGANCYNKVHMCNKLL